MAEEPQQHAASGDDAWDDIVSQLGEDVFKDVPDIIATPARPAQEPTEATPDTVEELDIDAFVQPRPPRQRMSRRTRAGIGLAVAGPVASYAATRSGLIDSTSSGYLGLFISIAGLFLIVTSLAGRHRNDDDSAPL